MGGLLIVISIVVPTLLWADLSNRFVWIAVFSVCAFGAIGFADDYIKVVNRRNLGLYLESQDGLASRHQHPDRGGADHHANPRHVLHATAGPVPEAVSS